MPIFFIFNPVICLGPLTQTSFSQPTYGMTFPTASTGGGGAFGFALSAVDKVAGKKKREQLESGVGSLAQCE
jgi:hypothetical protein